MKSRPRSLFHAATQQTRLDYLQEIAYSGRLELDRQVGRSPLLLAREKGQDGKDIRKGPDSTY